MPRLTSVALAAALTASSATAQSPAPFQLKPLDTHQPNGNPDGQVNYYHITFTVTAENPPGVNATGYCSRSWGDNSWTSNDAYSDSVPTDWRACDVGENSFAQDSPFQFRLYPYFEIGNYSIDLLQAYNETGSDGTKTLVQGAGSAHITNTTSQYTCQIDPVEAPDSFVHANGDCSIPDDQPPISVPQTSTKKCNANPVNIHFDVLEQTQPGDYVVVAGSIPELGNWDVSQAFKLGASNYGVSNPEWETDPNRSYTVPTNSCSGEVGFEDGFSYHDGPEGCNYPGAPQTC